ncbi:MAG: hypothetical protein RSA99_00065 [Oscillospiraceae bacterium]
MLIQNGNKAKISNKKKIIPVYETLTLISDNKSPASTITQEQAENAKNFVDENHK